MSEEDGYPRGLVTKEALAKWKEERPYPGHEALRWVARAEYLAERSKDFEDPVRSLMLDEARTAAAIAQAWAVVPY